MLEIIHLGELTINEVQEICLSTEDCDICQLRNHSTIQCLLNCLPNEWDVDFGVDEIEVAKKENKLMEIRDGVFSKKGCDY